MKFFKAFSLLHRRVKSATFEPGPTGLPQLATPPKAKTFSGREGDQARGSGLSFFDFVTSNPPVVTPSYFNHISRDDSASDRVLGLWPSRRHSDKGVLSTFQSSAKKECTRLTEAVNFWITEYTKVQNLLKNCHAELLVERLKAGDLESKLKIDQEEIKLLRATLDRYEEALVPSAPLENSDGKYTVSSNTLPAGTQIPSRSTKSSLSSQMPTGVNNPDQYTSALQMILVTRKDLRDQRKISKYWKGQAMVLGQQNTITPSVSTISSIQDSLPADRRLAVRALMAQRGISLRLAQLEEESNSPKTVHNDLQDSAVASDKTISRRESISLLPYANSDSFRLGPLASESLKQEVNMLYGPSSPSKRLFPSRSRQISTMIASKSSSVKTGLSNLSRYSHSIDSFGDINTLFQKAFGTKHDAEQQAIKHLEVCRESKSAVSNMELSLLVADKMLELSETLTSDMLESSIPSGCSQTWVNLETIDPEFVIPDLTLPSDDTHDVQLLNGENKDSTPQQRSWQLYITPKPSSPSSSNRTTQKSSLKKIPLRDMLSRKSEKENDVTPSLSLFTNRRKQSRLPVLTLAKKDVL